MHALAQKIAAAARPSHTVLLEITNISTLSAADADSAQKALAAELKRGNLRIIDDAAESASDDVTRVQVTFSQDVNGYLWIAEIRHGDSEQIEMVVPGHTAVAASGPPPIALGLENKTLWVQPTPILDFAQMAGSDGSKHLLLLEPRAIELERLDGNSWKEVSAQPISPLYLSRDLRGRLAVGAANQFQAFVAGSLCSGAWDPGLTLGCKENPGQEWPIASGWTSSYGAPRNFFVGVTTHSGSLAFKTPAFFSAASFESGNTFRRLFAELDGRAELFNDTDAPVAKITGWGSDIASIAIACDSNWHVLTTGTGGWTQPDQIQIYEITGRQAAAVGQPLAFPGPILALWPSDDGKSARVVSRNLQTGMYEASIVSATCGD